MFHSRVRSSGYGAASPVRSMFSPQLRSQVQSRARKSAVTMRVKKPYPMDCGRIHCLQEKNSISDKPGRLPQLHNGPVLSLHYSGKPNRLISGSSSLMRALDDAQTLLSSSTDSTSRLTKLPFGKYRGQGSQLTGHKGAVKSSSFSSDCSMIVTASADRSVCVYRLPRTEPVLRITNSQSNLKTRDDKVIVRLEC